MFLLVQNWPVPRPRAARLALSSRSRPHQRFPRGPGHAASWGWHDGMMGWDGGRLLPCTMLWLFLRYILYNDVPCVSGDVWFLWCLLNIRLIRRVYAHIWNIKWHVCIFLCVIRTLGAVSDQAVSINAAPGTPQDVTRMSTWVCSPYHVWCS